MTNLIVKVSFIVLLLNSGTSCIAKNMPETYSESTFNFFLNFFVCAIFNTTFDL